MSVSRCSCSGGQRDRRCVTWATERSRRAAASSASSSADHVEVAAAGQRTAWRSSVAGDRRDLAAEQPVAAARPARRPAARCRRAAPASSRLAVEDAAEPEQLVLDLVEACRSSRPTPSSALRASDSSASTRSTGRDQRAATSRGDRLQRRAGRSLPPSSRSTRPGARRLGRPTGRPGAGAASVSPTSSRATANSSSPSRSQVGGRRRPVDVARRAGRRAVGQRLPAGRLQDERPSARPARPGRRVWRGASAMPRPARRGTRRRCRGGAPRRRATSPTMRSASCTDSPPISPRSWRTTCSRCAASCSSPRWRIRSASCSACSRSSARIWWPSARASSRMRAASARRPASCSSYCRLSAAACSWASSARFSPPSILSVRSA